MTNSSNQDLATAHRPDQPTPSAIRGLVLEVPEPEAAGAFYAEAFGLGGWLETRAADAPTSGFRGFTLSLVVPQPATVDALIGSAVSAGATELRPVKKSLWGYGGVVAAPDGSIWKVATSSKKNSGAATRAIDDTVLLLGVSDVLATKKFYVERGFAVAKSFGRKYVEFEGGEGQVKLALYGRRALAKDAGVPAEGSGSHRIVIRGGSAPFTDPDGFTWEPA